MFMKLLSAREMMRGRKYGYDIKKEYSDKLFATKVVQVIRKWTHIKPFTMEIEVIKGGTEKILEVLGAIDNSITIVDNGNLELSIIKND